MTSLALIEKPLSNLFLMQYRNTLSSPFALEKGRNQERDKIANLERMSPTPLFPVNTGLIHLSAMLVLLRLERNERGIRTKMAAR